MSANIKVRLKYRLQLLVTGSRVLWLNLLHGWTTSKQRYGSYCEGYGAVQSASHRPPNPHKHPLLVEEFEAGADEARDDLRHDAEEEYMRDIQDTYDAIQREEMSDIFEECRELGLVGASVPTRNN